MNEVPNGSSIRRVPVSAEYIQGWLDSSEDSCNHWDQITWFLTRVFTQYTGFVAANLVISVSRVSSGSIKATHRIEVSQRGN